MGGTIDIYLLFGRNFTTYDKTAVRKWKLTKIREELEKRIRERIRIDCFLWIWLLFKFSGACPPTIALPASSILLHRAFYPGFRRFSNLLHRAFHPGFWRSQGIPSWLLSEILLHRAFHPGFLANYYFTGPSILASGASLIYSTGPSILASSDFYKNITSQGIPSWLLALL